MNNEMNKGFTLLEVLAVIFVITVGITGIFALIQTTSSSAQLIYRQLTATYLAQEGVELVRSVRDTNWLEGRGEDDNEWDEGIPPGEGVYEIDYEDIEEKDPNLSDYQGRYLKLDGNGYGYQGVRKTPYKRKIHINNEGDQIKVRAEVIFDFQKEERSVSSQEILYKWK